MRQIFIKQHGMHVWEVLFHHDDQRFYLLHNSKPYAINADLVAIIRELDAQGVPCAELRQRGAPLMDRKPLDNPPTKRKIVGEGKRGDEGNDEDHGHRANA